jgi:hypothetical protein
MRLREWAGEYLRRNSKIKQWEIISMDDTRAVVRTPRAKIIYVFQESLTREYLQSKDEMIIITLNTKSNVKQAQALFDEIDSNTRIIFANTDDDSFWILNPGFIRNYSTPDQFKKIQLHL